MGAATEEKPGENEPFVGAGSVRDFGDRLTAAVFGPQPTLDEVLERAKVMQEAKIEKWRRDTSAGTWLMWPFWSVGWTVGKAVQIIRGLWWNVRNGYNRNTTSPWTWDEDKEE